VRVMIEGEGVRVQVVVAHLMSLSLVSRICGGGGAGPAA
jgi:hypothetical protein